MQSLEELMFYLLSWISYWASVHLLFSSCNLRFNALQLTCHVHFFVLYFYFFIIIRRIWRTLIIILSPDLHVEIFDTSRSFVRGKVEYYWQTLFPSAWCFHAHIWSFLFPVISLLVSICVLIKFQVCIFKSPYL